MAKYLLEFKGDYEKAVLNPPDIIDVAILQWKTLYGTVDKFRSKYSNKWFFVSHEELSIAPLDTFEKIYSFLDIPFDKSAQKAIIKSTTASKSSRLKRDSAANIKSWKDKLTSSEIERVRSGTEGYWQKFYSDEDWI